MVYRYNNRDSVIENSSPNIQKNVGFEQVDLTQKIILNLQKIYVLFTTGN